jgi:D-ribose pyranose/furanose isomerase RbsD
MILVEVMEVEVMVVVLADLLLKEMVIVEEIQDVNKAAIAYLLQDKWKIIRERVQHQELTLQGILVDH